MSSPPFGLVALVSRFGETTTNVPPSACACFSVKPSRPFGRVST
jgi:hypothetical protein